MAIEGSGVRPRIGTPEQAMGLIASGTDLYNVLTGEFFWLYSEEGSIAHAWVRPDDPNLLERVVGDGEDLYEGVRAQGPNLSVGAPDGYMVGYDCGDRPFAIARGDKFLQTTARSGIRDGLA